MLYFFLLNKINNKRLSGVAKTISQVKINKTELFSSWFHILLRFDKDLKPRNTKSTVTGIENTSPCYGTMFSNIKYILQS